MHSPPPRGCSCSHSASDFNVVAAATSVLERLATIRSGRVQIVSESVALSLSSLLSHSDGSVRSAAIAALRVASDSIESRRTLAGYDDVAKLMTQSLCALNPVDGAFCCCPILSATFSNHGHFVSAAPLSTFSFALDICASHLHPTLSAASETGIQTVQALTNMVKEDRATSVAITAGLMPMICKLLVAYNPTSSLTPHGNYFLESLLVLLQNVSAWSAAKLALVSAGVIPALLPCLEASQQPDIQRIACSALALILVCIPGKQAAQPLCGPLVTLLSCASQRELYVNAKQALKSACEEAKFRATCAAMLRASVPDELEDITCGRA